MARREPTFICQTCSAAYDRLKGMCDVCHEYDTIRGSYPRHLDTGMAFQDWLKHPAGFQAIEPIGLEEMSKIITGSFSCDQKQWLEAMQLCITHLLDRKSVV